MSIKQLTEQRKELVNQAKHILETAKRDGERALSGSEVKQFDDLKGRLDEIDGKIEGAREREDRAREINEYAPGEIRRIANLIYGDTGRQSRTGGRPSFLPSHREYRAMAESSDGAGGYFVPEIQASNFFDRVAAESVVLQANPRVLEMSSDTLNVPKIGSSVTAAMTSENAEISASDIVAERVQLVARKAAALTRASNEVLSDSNPALREVLEYDHIRAVRLLLDAQFLSGNGSAPNLRGIRNFSGVTSTELGSGAGAAPTLDDIADAIGRLEADNAKATAIFMAPRSWNVFRTLLDGQDRYQLQPDPTTESRRSLFGVPVFTSGQISVAETVGASTDCSWIAVVDMSQVVIGRRSEVYVSYLGERYAEYDQTAIRTTSRWAIAPVNEEGVELITGVRA